jgi:ADP-heptose:LPS heptosyltransferase
MALRILIVKRDKIGDLLLTTPLFAHLREQLAGARIDVLCTDYNAWVIQGNRSVDGVFALPRIRVGRTLRVDNVPANLLMRSKLACRHYDITLVAQGEESPRAITRAFTVRSRRVVAYAIEPHRYGRRLTDPIPPPVETMHEVDRLVELARILGLSIPPKLPDPEYLLPDVNRLFAERWLAQHRLDTGGYVVLGLGARRRSRQPSLAQVERWSLWMRERYGFATVLVWTPGSNENAIYPGDDAIAEPVLRMRLPHVYPYRGPVGETLGLVWHARTSIFPDSGLMHFAAASPGGVIGLFPGPRIGQPASRWSPRGKRARWIEAKRDVPSEPDDALFDKFRMLLTKPSFGDVNQSAVRTESLVSDRSLIN